MRRLPYRERVDAVGLITKQGAFLVCKGSFCRVLASLRPAVGRRQSNALYLFAIALRQPLQP